MFVGLNLAKVHLYADDTDIYSLAPSLKVAMGSLYRPLTFY